MKKKAPTLLEHRGFFALSNDELCDQPAKLHIETCDVPPSHSYRILLEQTVIS